MTLHDIVRSGTVGNFSQCLAIGALLNSHCRELFLVDSIECTSVSGGCLLQLSLAVTTDHSAGQATALPLATAGGSVSVRE